MNIYISSNLKFLREQSEVTQETLGNFLSVGIRQIIRYENNPSHNLGIQTILEICDYFDVDAKEFIFTDLRKK